MSYTTPNDLLASIDEDVIIAYLEAKGYAVVPEKEYNMLNEYFINRPG
jgi:hypothetical protein